MANVNNFDETNIYLDFDPINPEPEHSESKKPGRKKDAVWNYFIEDEVRKAGHSSSKCVYCGETKDRGRVPDMMAHLALQCESVEASVKEEYLKILAESSDQSSEKSTTKKRKINKIDEEIATGIQPKITSKLQSSTIDSGQRSLCNKALTRFFVCCGIPFATVESPFFIDLVKNLCAGYQLPDRNTLSNT
jgi:BED zinc finger